MATHCTLNACHPHYSIVRWRFPCWIRRGGSATETRLRAVWHQRYRNQTSQSMATRYTLYALNACGRHVSLRRQDQVSVLDPGRGVQDQVSVLDPGRGFRIKFQCWIQGRGVQDQVSVLDPGEGGSHEPLRQPLCSRRMRQKGIVVSLDFKVAQCEMGRPHGVAPPTPSRFAPPQLI